MELIMSVHGERFVEFLKAKLRERKGRIDGYKDTHFAVELGVEYTTLKRWLALKSVERIDIENYFSIEAVFKDEFTNFMKHGK